jgi:hypothetical protein
VTKTADVVASFAEGAYVECVDWDYDRIECYPGEQDEKTTQLEGVSMDVFVRHNGVQKLAEHREFAIDYLMKK